MPDNRLTAVWKHHANQAATWRALCLGQGVVTALGLGLCYHLLQRPREVVRIGCDGVPQLVRLDVEQYSEPSEREIQAFVRRWSVGYARADSFSAVHDAVDTGRYMVPELRDAYRLRMRGTTERPGLVAHIQALKRRTEIEPNALDVRVNTRAYPWAVEVRGVRKIVGRDDPQPFGLSIKLVRAPREQVLEGMLVQEVSDFEVVVPEAGGER
jgi:hypothetical protein